MSKKQKHITHYVVLPPAGSWAYCTICEWMSDVIALYNNDGIDVLMNVAHQHEEVGR